MTFLNPGYHDENALRAGGFARLGTNVRIATTCTIVGAERIEIGSNVRIDGYCSIIAAGTGYLKLGSFIHIGSYCFLAAGDGIVLQDFSGLSQAVRIYSRTDDYSGEHLTNPTVPEAYTGVTRGEVVLERHVIVGSGSVILPDVVLEEGAAVGALSLVTKSLDAWGVYFGCPARRLRGRSRTLLDLERRLRSELGQR
ncbi:MAG: acetyltransferase [Rhodocyclaceae bacterium]